MDRHPDEDELVALALGALPGPEDEVLRHLTDCPACHPAYDDVATGVDAVLPASPSVAAPGFETQVLDRLRLERPSDPDRSRYRIPPARALPSIAHVRPRATYTSPPAVRNPRRPAASAASAALVGRCCSRRPRPRGSAWAVQP
ncbi:hypothetical protein BX257_8291 [Streptomyces sp. 3212.3]|jgi:hypothetical protein|nr:hypothetical protein ADL25_05415 [Streptomyces sp. NRRL F-5122]REE65556.1 hypothetical protein BX257_8291 [Streptomyces sp. 3212.3]